MDKTRSFKPGCAHAPRTHATDDFFGGSTVQLGEDQPVRERYMIASLYTQMRIALVAEIGLN